MDVRYRPITLRAAEETMRRTTLDFYFIRLEETDSTSIKRVIKR